MDAGQQKKTCLQFSWLGPNSKKMFTDKELVGKPINGLQLSNRTCATFPKPHPIPCIEPFLVNDLGVDLPLGGEDYKELIVDEIFHESVLCDPGIGDICAVTAFLFNDNVVNLTAYCTRVTMENSDPFVKGCIAVSKGTYRNVVCVCDPPCRVKIPGPNSSTIPKVRGLALISCVIAFLVNGWH
ncbi:ABC transporter A family member 4 [Frankliniella fusca]|uniref:ABC transporter A family member 4 n=1 Tax=Frankliniella fusca TaxID=407009 RepID=A0AAE1LEC4_9NEOP|nr:ABC transporter A family member 4 [Frankliniella fusca]